MKIKVKTVYSDRVKPSELVEYDENDVGEELTGLIAEAIGQMISDDHTLIGIYVSRED